MDADGAIFSEQNFIELKTHKPSHDDLCAWKEDETRNAGMNHYMLNWLKSGAASFACVKVYEESTTGEFESRLIWYCPELTRLYDKMLTKVNTEAKTMKHFSLFLHPKHSNFLLATWRRNDESSIRLAKEDRASCDDDSVRVHDQRRLIRIHSYIPLRLLPVHSSTSAGTAGIGPSARKNQLFFSSTAMHDQNCSCSMRTSSRLVIEKMTTLATW